MEIAVILSNLARHSTYIRGTASHLLSHVRTNMDMIGPHLLPNEIDQLNSDLAGAVTAVSSLQQEVLTLQTEVERVRWHFIHCPHDFTSTMGVTIWVIRLIASKYLLFSNP